MKPTTRLLMFIEAQYSLYDRFTTALAAGQVNGSAVSETGNKRTVTDTNSKLSVSGGVLTFATGGVGNLDPALVYPAMDRVPGMIFMGSITPSNTSGSIGFAIGVLSTGGSRNGIYFFADGTIRVHINDGTAVNTGYTYTGATTYRVAIVIRGTGYFYLIKGGVYTNWTLIFTTGLGSGTATLYPAISTITGTVSVFTADDIRIPAFYAFFPAPTASDQFARADGAIGVTDGLAPLENNGGAGLSWTGSTWTVVSQKAVNTPGLGSDDIVNGAFGADTDWSKGTGWTITGGRGTATTATGDLVNTSEANSTIGVWYQVTFDAPTYASGSLRLLIDGTTAILPDVSSTGSRVRTLRAIAAGKTTFRGQTSLTATVDNVTRKPLTLKDLFAEITTGQPSDVQVSADLTISSGTQCGIVMNLDNDASPANFVIAYHDGNNIHLDKCVAGTYTSIINASATYSAGASIKLTKIGTSYSLNYNNLFIGSLSTISDAGIISNTKHGMFSTYSINTIDNFIVRPVGIENQYSQLDSF